MAGDLIPYDELIGRYGRALEGAACAGLTTVYESLQRQFKRWESCTLSDAGFCLSVVQAEKAVCDAPQRSIPNDGW